MSQRLLSMIVGFGRCQNIFWVYMVHILLKNSQNFSVKELIYLALQFPSFGLDGFDVYVVVKN